MQIEKKTNSYTLARDLLNQGQNEKITTKEVIEKKQSGLKFDTKKAIDN